PLDVAETELVRLRAERETLLRRVTSRHPDAVRNELEIAKAQSVVNDLKVKGITDSPASSSALAKNTAAKSAAAQDDASTVEDEPNVAQVKSQLEANRMEVDNLLKEEQKLKASLTEYQSRLNVTPVREQQLAAIVRDYDLLKKKYEDLLSKEMESQLA